MAARGPWGDEDGEGGEGGGGGEGGVLDDGGGTSSRSPRDRSGQPAGKSGQQRSIAYIFV